MACMCARLAHAGHRRCTHPPPSRGGGFPLRGTPRPGNLDLQRPGYANNKLKRVFYQSAFCSLADPLSRAFYERKRREGKRHHQAVIALARRRIDVLWALIATRTPFSANHRKVA